MPQLRVTFAKDAKLGANEEEIPQIVLRAPTNELHSAPDAGQAQQGENTPAEVLRTPNLLWLVISQDNGLVG